MSFAVRDSEALRDILVQLGQGQVSLLELAEELPHGSGIDCQWSVVFPVNPLFRGNFYFHNEYHAMNENGMYDGYYSFKVTLFRHKRDEKHALCGPCAGKVQVTHRKGDLDFKVTGIRGKYHDALEWIHEGVYLAWEKYGIGKMRNEQVDA
jgi:hypothetical protein